MMKKCEKWEIVIRKMKIIVRKCQKSQNPLKFLGFGWIYGA
jgi:hypothetical protein